MTFDELEIGQVISLGAIALDRRALDSFCAAFAPGWDPENGAPDAMVFAVWSRLEADASKTMPHAKRLAVDALRWVRNPPPGELMRARMTIMGKDPVGESKGVVIAQHDLLDEAGRLIFSCLTRSVVGLSAIVRVTGTDRRAFEDNVGSVRLPTENPKADEYRKRPQITELNALNAASGGAPRPLPASRSPGRSLEFPLPSEPSDGAPVTPTRPPAHA